MLLNAEKIEEGTLFRCPVCIIGAGVAGISIALQLKKKGIDVCLIESGGLSADENTKDLYRGENAGKPYSFADGCRSRFLGGSSNCWGGWCSPFDAHDFATRSWVNESGWPLTLQELAPYYEQAHHILKLGPNNYDSVFWENAINHKQVKTISWSSDDVVNKIAQLSPVKGMGKVFRSELSANHIRVFLYSNVIDIEANSLGNTIHRVTIKTLKGKTFYVSASQFILATGGIENARLLLCSNRVHEAGLENNNDLVGRYFMDNPRLFAGQIRFKKEWSQNKFYDIKYNYHNSSIAALGAYVGAQFAVSPAMQEKEGLLNARVSFSSVFPGEDTLASSALRNLKLAYYKKQPEDFVLIKELRQIIEDPKNSFYYGLTRMYKPSFFIKNTSFQIVIEQEPNLQSRITLSTDVEALGMRRVRVNWQPGNNEIRTLYKTLSIFADELKKNGVAESVSLEKAMFEQGWLSTIQSTWHHMGTTRMNDNPKKGVVDKNGKVDGLHNLYIAGSSVFPTGGANYPTLTITALALRLADHIAKNMSGQIH